MTLLPLRAAIEARIEQELRGISEDECREIGKEAGQALKALIKTGRQKAAA